MRWLVRSETLVIFLLISPFCSGEGTKQFIPPGSSGKGMLLIGTNGAHTFGTSTSSAYYRLYVHIKDVSQESIKFGFGNASTGNPHYKIFLNNSDSTVYSGDTAVTIHVKYINGLTKFPVTNVDINTNGFQVSLERPSGSASQMYWDDQYYFPTLGSTNLTGCQYINPGDCHVWDWRAFGHDKTINTWLYVASFTTAPAINLVEWAPAKPGSNAGPDTVCQDCTHTFTLNPNPNPDLNVGSHQWC